jgi:NAD(P)H-quinone oxidoreductase subunit 5
MTLTAHALTQLPLWHAALAVGPALVLATAAALAGGATPAWRLARGAALAALALAAASLLALAASGGGGMLLLRADGVGGTVALLVAFIGWVIVRYSQPYLDAERGEAGYVRWLLATLAAVMVVVASNHLALTALAWMATSFALHRLLTFFADRPAALLAAHKKFITGRAADLLMLAACAGLGLSFGTLQIDLLLARAAEAGQLPLAAQAAVVAIALAALLKCAQLPAHGWLIQVMEAPTPVSALLHAGVVNLGGFVLIRLAPLVAETTVAAALLVVAGAATAVVAALVMTTRVSIKVALAWSTCAQMGFMLMQCGLGLWGLALLHLVAHSLYKAHAFLGAGGVVRQTMVRQLAPASGPAPVVVQVAGGAVGLAAVTALAVVGGLVDPAQPALWVMAGVVALALAPLARPGGAGGAKVWLRAATSAFALAGVYLLLHAATHGWVAPASAQPQAPLWLFVAAAFALLFALQCAVTAHPQGALARSLYPWFYGGLFLDERFSHALLRLRPAPRPPQPPAAARTAWPDAA